MSPTFERFNDRARRVLVLAQEEARLRGADRIGSEHLLLGLACEGSGERARGTAAVVLAELGVDRDRLGTAVTAAAVDSDPFTLSGGSLPFTPRVKRILELALREALALGHAYIGTEHLLLAVCREGSGEGAAILRDTFGLTLTEVRKAVITKISSYRQPNPTPTPLVVTGPADLLDKIRPAMIHTLTVVDYRNWLARLDAAVGPFPDTHPAVVVLRALESADANEPAEDPGALDRVAVLMQAVSDSLAAAEAALDRHRTAKVQPTPVDTPDATSDPSEPTRDAPTSTVTVQDDPGTRGPLGG